MACVSHASFLKRTLSTRLSPRQPPLQPLARSNRRAGIIQLNSMLTQSVPTAPLLASLQGMFSRANCRRQCHCLYPGGGADSCPSASGVLTPSATLLSGSGAMTSPLSGLPRQGGYAPKLRMKRSLPRAILLYEGERKRERGLPRAILLYGGERRKERGKGKQRKEREKKFSKPKQTSVPPPLLA